MNRSIMTRAAAAALCLWAATAVADPSPPLGCAGQPGVGGCPPYLNVVLSDGAGTINLYEYELPMLEVSRSLPLSAARGTANLPGGTLTAAVRRAEDNDPGNNLGIDLSATLTDLFTLHSANALPPGGDVVNIVAMASAQGVGSIDVDYRTVQSILHIGFGSGVLGYGGGVLDHMRVIQAVSHVPTFQQFVVPLAVYANLTVQVGVPFDLNLSLRTIGIESSFLDFDAFGGIAHGAQLSFLLPPGFSVTSMGGFDSASPVPEPEALSLWLAGLGMLGLACRRLRRRTRGAGLAAVVSALMAAGPAQAGLVGDTVTAELVDLAGAGGVTTPFAASAVVGAGPEFTGVWNYTPLNQVWQVALDIDDSGFAITFTDVGGGGIHDLAGFTFLGLRLGDLDAGGAISGVSVLGGDAAVQSIGWSARGITVQWNGFQFRDANGGALASGGSSFAFQTAAAVPEPGSAALLLVGLAGMALVARHRRR